MASKVARINIPESNRSPPTQNGAQQNADPPPGRVYGRRSDTMLMTSPGLERTTTIEKASHAGGVPSSYKKEYGTHTKPRLQDVKARSSRQDNTLREPRASAGSSTQPRPYNIREMQIMHHWTQGLKGDNLFVPTINMLPNKEGQKGGRITWIHLEDPLPSLEHIEEVFRDHIEDKLAGFVADTTRSLLKRIRTDWERKFVHGQYLNTDAIRYSARSLGTDDKDQPCLFLIFPFLAKGEFQRPRRRNYATSNHPQAQQVASPKGAIAQPTHVGQNGHVNGHHGLQFSQRLATSFTFHTRHADGSERREHPPRTLLQTRYRLESTSKRDKMQAILTLPTTDVQDSIRLPDPALRDPNNAPGPYRSSSQLSASTKAAHKKQKLYIPQLWSLSLSGDIMLTCGPFSLEQLCGSEIDRRVYKPEDLKSSHKVVCFNVNSDSGQKEQFFYPADRCEWFFGLVNKQRKIEDTLNVSFKFPAPTKVPGKCLLYYTIVYRKDPMSDGTVVDTKNWLSIQHDHSTEYLELYLEMRDLPSFKKTNATPATAKSPSPGLLNPNNVRDADRMSQYASSSKESLPPTPRSHSKSRSKASSLSDLILADLNTPAAANGNRRPRANSVYSGSHGLGLTEWPSGSKPFFHWRFYEEIDENSQHSEAERLNAWLEKVHTVVSEQHFFDIAETLLRNPKNRSSHPLRLIRETISSSDLDDIESKIMHQPEVIQNRGTPEMRAVTSIYENARNFIKLFIPSNVAELKGVGDDPEDTVLVRLYWGLIFRILDGITRGRAGSQSSEYSATNLQAMFENFLQLTRNIHRGMWRAEDNSTNPSAITLVAAAIVPMQVATLLENVFDLCFTIIATMEETLPADSPDVKDQTTAVLKEIESIEEYLVSEADENRHHKALGPVVTPEGITLLLLNRLGDGMYREGTINVIDIYEKVIERLASKVESSASRVLLLDISRVIEEVDVILETYKHQKRFLEKYKSHLDPLTLNSPSTKRTTRFIHEKAGIEQLEKDVQDRIQSCTEIHQRIELLADQNLKRVEAYQDDNNRKLMIFTLVTVFFLPPSFVTSFLGMNVVGVQGKDYTVKHFWEIAAPLTLGITSISLVLLFWDQIKRRAIQVWEHIHSSEEDDY